MKFLIDAQLPSKLCEILEAIGIDAVHVDSLPKKDETSDKEIIIHADANDLIVISKDSDFYHSHMILGQPKKLLLITTGNIKNRKLFDLIRPNILIITNLFETCNYVEMTNDGIIGHE
jgi:predicted nuclease of predicted toxin-antitoxin system